MISAFQDGDLLNVNDFVYKLFQLTLQEWKQISIKHDLSLVVRNLPMWMDVVSSLGNHSFNDDIRNDILEMVIDYCIILINLWIEQNNIHQFVDSSSAEENVVTKDIVTNFMPNPLSSNLKSREFQEDLKDFNKLHTQWQSISCNSYHDKNELLQNTKSNISYSSPNYKYIYLVSPDDIIISQQIKVTLAFVLVTHNKSIQDLNSHGKEDAHIVQDKALCVLLFNKWLFNEFSITIDPKMEEIVRCVVMIRYLQIDCFLMVLITLSIHKFCFLRVDQGQIKYFAKTIYVKIRYSTIYTRPKLFK